MSPETDALVEAIAERAAALVLERLETTTRADAPSSPYMTVPEAADYLRCKRQRIDDLLSQGRLTRIKDGSRTLIERTELEAHLRGDDPLLTPSRKRLQTSRSR